VFFQIEKSKEKILRPKDDEEVSLQEFWNTLQRHLTLMKK
jgi:hypothetical protein